MAPLVLRIASPVLLAACAGAATLQGERSGGHGAFDFWIGEWAVQNRFLVTEGEAAGTYADRSVTRARITPVVGGKAILEEWAGPLHGGFMNGFSLRAWNARLGHWEILLNWTTNGDGAFGVMRGGFRHGRGEFLSRTTGEQRERYTFSDTLADSVRWDGARTRDGGRTWETYWIMEFTRTRAAREVTLERFFAEDWNAGTLSRRAEARRLDRLVGTWSGLQHGADGEQREARLRCRLVNKDCLVVDVLEVLEVREEGAGWDERLSVRSLVMPAGRWESWRTSEARPDLRRFACVEVGEGAVVFEHRSASGDVRRESLVFVDADTLVIEEEVVPAGAAEGRVTTTELTRRAVRVAPGEPGASGESGAPAPHPLQGYWEGEGNYGRVKMTVAGDSLFFHGSDDFQYDTRIELVPGSEPSELKATILDTPRTSDSAGEEVVAIYRFEGERLILAAVDPNQGRPLRFEDAYSTYTFDRGERGDRSDGGDGGDRGEGRRR